MADDPPDPIDAPVLVDHREGTSGIPDLLRAAGLPVQEVDLPVADYVLSGSLAVERKSEWDLTSSIKDGRLFDQAERLQEAFAQAVLIIEGEPAGMPEHAWRGAVCKLVEDGVTVIHSLDLDDSAEWILRLARRARRRGGAPRVIGRRRAAPTPARQAQEMLACVPGISHAMSRVLLERFGSVAAIAASDPSELRATPGIGAVRAARLLDALTTAGDSGPGTPAAAAPVDREADPRDDDRRWVILGPDGAVDDLRADGSARTARFARRAIALRALVRRGDGAALLDRTTGEIVATHRAEG